ncbi:glycosyltransferase family 2 protein [Klebsiella pneumoniae]|uniref:Putative glucuronosyltransferase n=4 Tax=Bacteria TaxID=2 RepID=A0A193SE11_KLEPN|nr:glycosyltransferase family 2 protein [Klebsiella pneumoniae]EIV5267514.1 glycosyltransferase family 2 protein [Klebsiella pneumoniae]EJA2182200.1 glycosyltransferase family 2 protein [Klebsiella pneumoniae]EJK8811107.1 glycosyltransferase family 2 protein [Klebsiella pneumoniae]EKS3850744.1 glycosyltransferase family 2 protein [Klebsiella pneumoniae]EKU4984404.1 glycosyltransferase family 2 protein [Klebsiella pneumoniae]
MAIDVSIALATYNGSRYINELLNSIKLQTYNNFIIHVCDDGSSDNTLELLHQHPLYNEGRLIVHDVTGGQGALKNFKRSLSYCDTDYICLCDQDDYWMPDKLETLLSIMKDKENEIGEPVLVFSDLEVVDSTLNCIHKSFFRISNKSNQCRNPEDFLISNHIPGCVMMFNRSLKNLFDPIPDDVRMHDWWIALIAAYYGNIFYANKPLIKYRQHGGNVVGASGMFKQEGITLAMIRNIPELLRRNKVITSRFVERFNNLANPTVKNEKFLSLVLGKITYKERLSLLKKVKSGESKYLTYLVWWFI